jgi:hypothetical protein
MFNPSSPFNISSSIFYPVGAGGFDGSATYLSFPTAGITGGSFTSSFSGWVNFAAGDGTLMEIFDANIATSGIKITRNSSNKIAVHIFDNASSFDFSSVNSYTTSSGWVHIAASWNSNFSAGNKLSHLYINGVSDKNVTSDASAAFQAQVIGVNFGVGATPSGGSLLNGSLSQIIFGATQFVDLSVLANLRKFISATRRPIKFTGFASGITDIYLNGANSNFNINSGTIGNLTTHGTLGTPSTTPSAP